MMNPRKVHTFSLVATCGLFSTLGSAFSYFITGKIRMRTLMTGVIAYNL